MPTHENKHEDNSTNLNKRNDRKLGAATSHDDGHTSARKTTTSSPPTLLCPHHFSKKAGEWDVGENNRDTQKIPIKHPLRTIFARFLEL